jgi:hypothetical protein
MTYDKSGVVGVGGSLHDPRGNRIVYYAQGLGNVTNNLAEAYSLWKGMYITKKEGLNALSTLISRINKALSNFDKISFFHIKRELNGNVNH